jgi:hypothetical protein
MEVDYGWIQDDSHDKQPTVWRKHNYMLVFSDLRDVHKTLLGWTVQLVKVKDTGDIDKVIIHKRFWMSSYKWDDAFDFFLALAHEFA